MHERIGDEIEVLMKGIGFSITPNEFPLTTSFVMWRMVSRD